MTPIEMRDLAARAMVGKTTNGEIDKIAPWTKGRDWTLVNKMMVPLAPNYLGSLDAADLLMAPLRERGWIFQAALLPNWCWIGAERWIEGGGFLRDRVKAPTEPRARTALALLCMAAEMETTP